MKRKMKLLFVGPCKRSFRSFMQQDLDILTQEFDVRLVNFCVSRHDWKATCTAFYNLIAGVAWADVIFCWFAGLEAFFATAFSQLFHKKTAVVAGGGDVTAIAEIGYGAPSRRGGRFFTTFALNRATKVLPYSKDAEKNVLRFLKHADKVELVYLGIDTEKFCPSETKRDQAITVSAVWHRTLKRKGLETFVESAAYLPEVKFFLIGQFMDDSINYLRSIASKNVVFTGFLSESELIRCYRQAKAYIQVSAHEAFGVALAEAMACECVPVVTDKGSIPEVVGTTGVCVPYGDAAATAKGIKQALELDDGAMARQRIEKMFAIDKRREALLNAINGLFD